MDLELLISKHDEQVLHGTKSTGFSQRSDLAKMRALEVLPVPLGPVKTRA
jgi:hypothetical protein